MPSRESLRRLGPLPRHGLSGGVRQLRGYGPLLFRNDGNAPSLAFVDAFRRDP